MVSPSAPIDGRERSAFRADAAFEVFCGSVLMANPLVGPDLRINGFLVGLVGILLMVAAVFLGGAGLGKSPLAGNLRLVAMLNALSGVGLLAWVVIGSLSTSAIVLVLVMSLGLLCLAAFQAVVVRTPNPTARRVAPTQAELHAALRGEHPAERRS
jgi:hypothetical protein